MTRSCSLESGVTMEVGLESVGEEAARHFEDSSLSGRCVVPRVHSAVNLIDQQVPVYWDQTVPVWPSSCKQVDHADCKRKPALTWSRSSCGECFHTVNLTSSLRNRGEEEESNGDGGRQSARAIGNTSSKVSFEDIMSMYQSSVMCGNSSHMVQEIVKQQGRPLRLAAMAKFRRHSEN